MRADLESKYFMKNKGLDVMIQELKQRIKVKNNKLHSIDKKIYIICTKQAISKQPKTLV